MLPSSSFRRYLPSPARRCHDKNQCDDIDKMLRILGKKMDLVKTDEALDRACRKYLVKAWEERKVISTSSGRIVNGIKW